jgi:hypothetical protein
MFEVQSLEVDGLPALLSSQLGLFSIFWFPWVHHMSSLADVTMVTKACTLL